MSRTTFANALDELFGLLSAAGTAPKQDLLDAGVRFVLDHEPGAAGVPKPCSVTMEPAGIDPTDWMVRVRVYVAGELPPKTAQDLLVNAAVATAAVLKTGVGYGPLSWQMGWNDEIAAYVAVSDVAIGREDF